MPLVHDFHSKNLNLPLPDKENFLQDDVERLIQTINTLDEKVAIKDASGRLDTTQLPDIVATLDKAGGVLHPTQIPPLVVQVEQATGKIPAGKLPAAGLTNKFEVSNQAGMLALKPTIGDVCHRLDNGGYFMLVDTPASLRSSWRELPQTAVASVNGKVGAVTGIAESGVNHDITDLTGLTGQLHLPVDGTDEMAAVTKRQLDKAGGGYVSQLIWHHNRSSIPDGYIVGDGQEVSQTMYASLYAEVVAKRVPVCTEAEWWANPAMRACYTLGAQAGMFRLPDYNGAVSGSIGAPFLRGSLPVDAQYKGWIQSNAAPNIKGSFDLRFAGTVASPWTIQVNNTGAFTGGGVTTINAAGIAAGPQINKTQATAFDASRSHASYGRTDAINGIVANEVRPNAIVGVYIIRFAGRALNAGAVDALALSTEVARLSTFRDEITKLGNTIGYELLDFGTMAINQRKVLPNPFGNNTPVICRAELYHDVLKKWISGAWTFNPVPNPPQSHGLYVAYSENEGIVLRTGNNALVSFTGASGATGDMTASYSTPSRIRVHVWNIGNDTTALELQRANVAKLSDLWLPYNDPRVLEYIEWPSDLILTGNLTQQPYELLVNIKPNAIHIKGLIRRFFKAPIVNPIGAAAAVIAANDLANTNNNWIFRVKKMLPGFSSVPRTYVRGICSVNNNQQDLGSPAATKPIIQAGFVTAFAGLNDDRELTTKPYKLNKAILGTPPGSTNANWFMFDGIISFV